MIFHPIVTVDPNGFQGHIVILTDICRIFFKEPSEDFATSAP